MNIIFAKFLAWIFGFDSKEYRVFIVAVLTKKKVK